MLVCEKSQMLMGRPRDHLFVNLLAKQRTMVCLNEAVTQPRSPSPDSSRARRPPETAQTRRKNTIIWSRYGWHDAQTKFGAHSSSSDHVRCFWPCAESLVFYNGWKRFGHINVKLPARWRACSWPRRKGKCVYNSNGGTFYATENEDRRTEKKL